MVHFNYDDYAGLDLFFTGYSKKDIQDRGYECYDISDWISTDDEIKSDPPDGEKGFVIHKKFSDTIARDSYIRKDLVDEIERNFGHDVKDHLHSIGYSATYRDLYIVDKSKIRSSEKSEDKVETISEVPVVTENDNETEDIKDDNEEITIVTNDGTISDNSIGEATIETDDTLKNVSDGEVEVVVDSNATTETKHKRKRGRKKQS